MARQFNVIRVQDEGRVIGRWTAADRASVPGAPPEVSAGERLVAVVNNGKWQSAVDVTHPSFFVRIRQRYVEGVWNEMALYAIDDKRAEQIEDGRRILMNGLPVRDPASALTRVTTA